MQAAGLQPRKGIVRVKLQPEVAKTVAKASRLKAPGGQITSGVGSLDNALNLIAGVNIRPMLKPNPKFAAERAKYGLDQWYVVTFDESLAPEEVRKQLGAVAGIMRAEVVKPMSITEGNGSFRAVKAPAQKAPSSYPFNDPRLAEQWHYQNYGNLGTRVEGADINLFEAWKKCTGNKDVLVAIIDGGVDYTHEDLAANMFINEKELNGKEGYDDDDNGYVDDIYGYNFCNNGPVYPHSHGTHVAGTVAAVNNNGIGVCGVAGGDGTPDSGVKMISVQVFDSRQGSGDADFAEAIIYARERGASIAQCSWGWAESGYYEEAVLRAIDYFTDSNNTDRMAGGLMIFAAGNEGTTGEYYPGCYEKVVSVAAMTSELRPASYSCYGNWVDIIAPGGLLDYGESEGILSTLPNNEYGYNEGTSMATPHVSGIAALILSKYGKSDFTNESLRTQLITSVNDFYGVEGNEKFRGEYGSGYIDAAKALQMGDGSAPDAVTDISLQAAQDYIEVTWTIPNSSDNNVHSHIIYYSTEPFTATSDLTKLKTIIADTKFYNSGDKYTQEITNLTPLTTYYVAIKAVSRWGAASELSEVKEIKTNEGPKMTLSTDYLSFGSTLAKPIGETTFTIGNEADGILKWEAAASGVSITSKNYARRIDNPVPGTVVNEYKGNIRLQPMASKSSGLVSSDYEASDYPKNLKYYDTYYAVIGDNDKTLPNSMAQLFWVDPEVYPNGFNLTHLLVDYTYGANPKIEIYRGPTPIATATKIQDVAYNWFFSNSPIALKEQIHFNPADSFWIVVHFEGNQESWPLPVALYDTDKYSYVGTYSWMSNDMGKSWVSLKKALAGSIYEPDAEYLTWGITARSANPDFSEILDLTPAKGTVTKGETQEVKVSVDGSKLVNGDYKFNLKLNTNQTENSVVSVPVEYEVAGNKPIVKTPRVVDFGSLLVGESKTLTVEVFNEGYGPFTSNEYFGYIGGQNITSTSEHFKGPEDISGGIPSRSRVKFNVTYTPTSAGSHTGSIVVKGIDGEFKVVVRGVATDPSKLAIEPATIDAGDLDVAADETVVKFNVKNEGNYPLEYVFPKFSNETIDGNTSKLHQYGYSVTTTFEDYKPGFEYTEPVAMTDPVDIHGQFSDNVYLSEPISMGFDFPFYGKNYDKVYITSFGGICFEPNTITLRDPLYSKRGCLDGMGYISAYGSILNFGAKSKVEYAKQDGKFVVKYTDCLGLFQLPGGDTYKDAISFRIVLSANGDIEIFYDDYTAIEMFQDGSTLFCGITDPEVEDYVEVTSCDIAQYAPSWWENLVLTDENQRFTKFNDKSAVKFSAPKANFVRSVEPAYGLVNPGESVDVIAVLKADETLVAGETYNDITIVTNDTHQEISGVRVNANITGECFVGVPAVQNADINLGDVFRTASVKTPVTIKNNGSDKLTITSIEKTGNIALDENLTTPITLDARMAKDIFVIIPTSESGAVNGTVKISTTEGELEASVKANVIGCPGIDFSFESVNEYVMSGDPLHKDLVITNTGDEDLVYSIVPNPIAQLSLPANESAKTSYIYSYSDDDANVSFEWEDIETNGKGTFNGLGYYGLHDYATVELPFEFTYYGKTYNKIYIYNTGFVSFTERHDDNLWPEPPAEFPQGSVYSNIIAPYWGLHSPNQTTTSGTYHYVTEDRAVISWMEYANSMNYDVCYQLILEKDGQFKFQYKPFSYNGVIMNAFGVAGISNEDASDGVRLPDYMICFNKAVQFAPVTEYTLKPNEEVTVGIDFVTNKMQGEYNAEIKVNTNVPSKETLSIPVQLLIEGIPHLVWPEDVVVEHPMGYFDYNNPAAENGLPFVPELTIGNTGTAEAMVFLEFECPTIFDDYFQEDIPAFQVMYWGNVDYGIAPMTNTLDESTSVNTWVPYYPEYGEPLVVGKDGLKLIAVPMDGEFYGTPAETNLKFTFMTFDYENPDNEDPIIKEVNAKVIVTEAPMLYIEQEEVVVNAENDDTIEKATVKVQNVGEYKLTYNLVLDPTGEGENNGDYGIGDDWGIGWGAPKKVAADMKAANPELATLVEVESPNKVKANAEENTYSSFDVPNSFEFNKALFHEHLGNASYTYGPGNIFETYKAATRFTAPEEGFNISHIYTAIGIEDAKNYGVKIDIVNGGDPEGTEILGTGSVMFEKAEDPSVGTYAVIALEKPVYINPNQEFTVVASYDAGSKYPAYLCSKFEKVVEGRYQGWIESYGWFDVGVLFNDNYGSLGYIMACLETKKGQPWVRLLSADNGVIEAEGSAEFEVEVNPAAAPMEKNNKAMLVIKSNDPNQSVVNFPIYLNCNGRPVINVPTSTIAAAEGQSTNVAITVSDPDGDDLTISVSDSKEYASISSVVVDAIDTEATVAANEDGSYVVKGATKPVTVNVAITADYGTASTANLLYVKATDDKGHTARAYLRYDIEFKNRAPEAVDVPSVDVYVGQLTDIVNFEDFFKDPEGDEMTYEFSMKENRYVDAFVTNYGVVFSGKTLGEVRATITATDSHGESTGNIMNIKCATNSGVEGLLADADGSLKVLENPVVENLKVACGFNASEAIFTLYDAAGATVARQERGVVAGDIMTMNVSDIQTGVYMLVAEYEGNRVAVRVVKR